MSFEKWARFIGIPLEKVKGIYNKFREEGLTEDQALRMTRLTLTKHYDLISRSKATRFRGFIDGVGDLVDETEILMRRALKLVEQDLDRAIELGLANEEGIPIDNRETINFKPNPNFGGLLVDSPPVLRREIIGIAKRLHDGRVQTFRMWLREPLVKAPIKTYRPLEFLAIERENNILSPSRLTKFIEVEEEIPVEEWLIKHGDLKDLGSCLEYRYLERYLVDVIRIRLKVTKKGYRILRLVDPSQEIYEGVLGLYPYEIPINFGEGTRLVIVGIGRKFDDRIVMEIKNAYPLSEYKTKPGYEIKIEGIQ